MENNKKQILLAVLGVLVLVVAVVGVSFAMYTFTGTGSKTNIITTCTVNTTYAEATNINLQNSYPMSDAAGNGLTTTDNGVLDFTVSTEQCAGSTINYGVYFDNISITSDADAVTMVQNDIKFSLSKKVGSGSLAPVTDRTSVLLGTYGEATAIDNGTFTGDGSVQYILKAWVREDYELPVKTATDANGVHSNQTAQETVTFKIRVTAAA